MPQNEKIKCAKIGFAKIKKSCIKDLHGKNICTENLKAKNGKIESLTVNNINGKDFDCIFPQSNTSGKITPVQYVNGVPQKPVNTGNFNQKVLDELWFLNQLSANFTNLDSAYGRLRNVILSGFYDCIICPETELSECNCPITDYAVFKGIILKNILTVTEILDTSYTCCPPVKGTIKIGQRLYGKPNKFLNTVITGQISGEPGSIGTYSLENNFNESINVNEEDMLSLSDVGTEECASIPLKIYGVETLSVGPTGQCESLTSVLNYNFNIANKSLGTKIAAVYVQVGWEDLTTEEINIQGLVIDTKQFDYSILSFGEQMNNNVMLPSDLINTIYKFNATGVVNSVVQLVLFLEDGLELFLPEITRSPSASRKEINTVTNSTDNYSVSFSASSCINEETGNYKAYVQPNVGETVDITYSGISKQSLLALPNSVAIFTNRYMITSVNENTLTVLNIGYVGNDLPGTNLDPFPALGNITIAGSAGFGNSGIPPGGIIFRQPVANQVVDATFYFNNCVPNLIQRQQVVYLYGRVKDDHGATDGFLGIYVITGLFQPDPSLNQWTVSLLLLPGQLNVTAGSYISSYGMYLI